MNWFRHNELHAATSSLFHCRYSLRFWRMLLPLYIVLLASMLGQAGAQSVMTHHVREVTRNGEAPLVGQLPATQIMHLVLVLPLSHQTELQKFLRDLYDPSSPSYRHFLTVEEFTATFAPSQEDYDAVLHFAKANSLAVVNTSRNRMNADVVGSVASIEKTFQLKMGVYQHPKENRTFFAPDREPTVALPFPLWHIAGLDNYSIPRPLLRYMNSEMEQNATTGSGPSASFLGSDMRAAYYGGTLTGSGQSLGLVEYYGTDLDDLNTYYANVGETNNVPITLLSTDGTPTSCLASQGCDDTEQTIDMTQALGMAPGLSSLVVYVGSSDSAIFNAMATASPLNAQLSSSWTWYPADLSADDPYFQEFAAQGQNLFQAAGDSGSWVEGSEIYPADDAYVTSVGGTDLSTASAAGPWTSETVWIYGGGGISPDYFPIPSWQTNAADGCSSCSTTYRNGPDVSANADFTFYVCADQSACSANLYGGTSFAAPMWAAYLALANQQAIANGNPPLGFINPVLYTMGLSSSYDTVFHDVTSGNNGYSATTCYDLASGWGSPNGSGLINALAANWSTPGFFLAASPPSSLVAQGSSGTFTITSTATGGFSSPINLSASGQPTGVTVSFSPASISAAGTSTMTMTVGSSTATGNYAITVTGISGTTTETTTIFLTVTAPLTSITVTPASAIIQLPGGLQFAATGHYADGSTLSLTVAWASSNPSTATINTSGLATAVAYGNTNITASFGGITSSPATLTVAPTAAPPSFSPSPGTYNTPQTVTLSDSTPGVTIYYTTNGSTPTTSSPVYSGPITVSSTTTLQAIAAGNGYVASTVSEGLYQIAVAMPVFSPGPGTYNTPQTVTLSDVTPGATIYYTTNGSTPTTSSPVYSGPITISTNTTLQAIATAKGYTASSDALGIYQIMALAPSFSPSPGTYNTPQTVTLSDATPGVTIYYTTNGSTPTSSSPVYSGPITISSNTTLQAIAVGNGYGTGPDALGVYQIVALAPNFSPSPGTYNTPQTVTLSDATPGVTIYYTTNGSTPTSSSPVYSGPITISSNTTLQAIAVGNGYGTGPDALGVYQIVALAPNFSPSPGTYNTPQTVTLSDATPGATIYYTTNGSTPTTSSPVYAGPIAVSSSTTLQAIAVGNGYGASPDALGVYQIVALAPNFSPSPGSYNTPQTVTLSDATPGVTIYYTTNGSTPTTSSPVYTGPITVSASTTLQAIAAGNGYAPSSIGGGAYKIVAAVPAFSPSPGTYSGPESVTISDGTPGVTIYYTTNGSTPTTSSPVYSGPITMSSTTTLQAIAVGNGFGTSPDAIGVYQILALAPTFSPSPGAYNAPQTVTLSDGTPGVTIYYTTNGSTATTSSPVYTGPITVSSNITLHAIAAGNGYAASPQTIGSYQIVALAPSFAPSPGTYNTPQTVTLSDGTPGVTIYYTTNGSTATTSSPVYTGPITVSSNITFHAIAAGNGYGASPQTIGSYQIVALSPSFSPSPGTYNTPQTVTLSDTTPGVTIYYTTNGSTATTSSPVYTGPITVSSNTTLHAIAAGNGYAASPQVIGGYQIVALAPTFSPNPGTYNTPQTVTLSDATPGVTIYYTTNGSTPTTSSPVYTGTITISTNTTLHAMAVGNGYGASPQTIGSYQIVALTPSFSLNSGTYSSAQSVTISDATPGVTIYYTTNGSTPTTSSPVYTGPITISTNTTLQAIAAGNGYGASSEAFAVYVIN